MAAALNTSYRLEFDHSETIMRAVSSLTIDPLIQIFCYAVPWIAAYSAYQLQVRPNDKLQISLLSETAKQEIVDQIDALRISAGIDRNVSLYTSLNFSCSSYGGIYSIARPVISIPAPFLITPRGSIFSNREPVIQGEDQKWVFTPDEVTFFIAREIENLNCNLIRILTKVTFVAILVFVFTMPVSIVCGALTVGLSVILYASSERAFEGRLDSRAVKTLRTHFNDRERAKSAAFSALEKLRQQNIERRKTSGLCRYYITEKGNNLLDPCHPFLTTRIKQTSSSRTP